VEKSEQVSRMRVTYEKAFLTVAWLGPAAEESDSAMSELRSLGQ